MRKSVRFGLVALSAVIFGLGFAGEGRAQWVVQDLPLHAGWNAVHIGVRPSLASFEEAFGGTTGTNVLGVWRWDKAFTTEEYLYDEDSPLAQSSHWKVWLPGSGVSFLSTMDGFTGGQSYLIRLAEGTPSVTVPLKGRAMLPALEWYPNALNFVGFPVGPSGATVEEWFEATDGVDLSKGYDNEIFQISASGAEQTVVKPSVQKIRRGEAMWVRCQGALEYTSPLKVSTETGTGLDFGTDLTRIRLTVENLSTQTAWTVALRLGESATPPTGEELMTGPVPLYLENASSTNGAVPGWEAFTSRTVELPPGGVWQGVFGVRREEMSAREDLPDPNSSYQSVLSVADEAGKLLIDVPVRAVRSRATMQDTPVAGSNALDAAHAQAGLWIGEVSVTAVNCPNYRPDELLPVKEPLPLRLIVHVNDTGTAKLLREVWVAPTAETNAVAGLYAARSLVPQGATDVRRLSVATLPAMAPLILQSAHEEGGLAGELTATVTLAYDDPVNPFFHRYHPMFDNKDGAFSAYTNAVETRSVWRDVTLSVSDESSGLADASQTVSGTYAETLRGVRAQDIRLSGTFQLQKVLAQGTLEELEQGGGE